MLRKWFILSILSFLMLSLTLGCGIPQEQYDALAAELSAAQNELQSVKAELGSNQSKVSELTSSLEKSQGELQSTRADLKSTQSELDSAKESLAAIEEVYPPRDFTSLTELEEWLRKNNVSERPITEYGDE